jgi:uncharacterized protein (DUF3820 family)
MKREISDIEFEMFTMPFGKYRGKLLFEIPASYMLWIVEEKFCPDVLKAWVELHEDEITESALLEECDATEWDLY